MAYNANQDGPPDPTALLRQRVTQQVAGDPTVPTGPSAAVPRNTTQPVAAAPFDTNTGPTGTPGGAKGQINYQPGQLPSIPLDNYNPATGAYTPTPGTYTPPASAFADPSKNLGVALGAAPASGPNAWIDQALQQAQSTDDPNYWYSKIAADPKAMAGDPSAIAYWQGRIAQGDGALAVRNGTKQKFQDTAASTAAAGAAVTPATNPFTDQVRQLLLARMAKDSQPVSDTDQNIAAPLDAARLEAGRSQQQERTALAEQLYAQGDLGSNSLNQGIQQSAEREATGLSQVRAGLLSQEYASRRADLNDAMQQALATGDAESARQLQLAIANLDAQVQREGLGVTLAIDSANKNANGVTSLT
jgi:hypothetical protein